MKRFLKRTWLFDLAIFVLVVGAAAGMELVRRPSRAPVPKERSAASCECGCSECERLPAAPCSCSCSECNCWKLEATKVEK